MRVWELLVLIALVVSPYMEGSSAFMNDVDDDNRHIVVLKSHRAFKSFVRGHEDIIIEELPLLNTVITLLPTEIEVNSVRSLNEVQHVQKDIFDEVTDGPSIPDIDTSTRSLSVEEEGWNIQLIKALNVSDDFVSNKKLCILCSGVDVDHEDLPGYSNFSGYDSWDSDSSSDSHGTHNIGIISALGGNNKGIVGIVRNGNINIHVAKVFNSEGRILSSSLINGLNSCAQANSDIISIPLTLNQDTVFEAAIETLHNNGALIIGESYRNRFPASMPSVIATSAIDADKQFLYGGTNPDISAPGGGAIVSTLRDNGYGTTNLYSASSHVAGVAALVWSIYPHKTNVQIRRALEESAEDLGSTGKDSTFGWGLLRADLARDFFVRSAAPSALPTSEPSVEPSLTPSLTPSSHPSLTPSKKPSDFPSLIPSSDPSQKPASIPSNTPSLIPSTRPSFEPSFNPSAEPSLEPSLGPSTTPSGLPSKLPSSSPSLKPSLLPTSKPSLKPSASPSEFPSKAPSGYPSVTSSAKPSIMPSSQPSLLPSAIPSTTPSLLPSVNPTLVPTSIPSLMPSSAPTLKPTMVPTVIPSHIPTSKPSSAPSLMPSAAPTLKPTMVPTVIPSQIPTSKPSLYPSGLPSTEPSLEPSVYPSTEPSRIPSSYPTLIPSSIPTVAPSLLPSLQPSTTPSTLPSTRPSLKPTGEPSIEPSSLPSIYPSLVPSLPPSLSPSSIPSVVPTALPSLRPSSISSHKPSSIPSLDPSSNPSSQPTLSRFPSTTPSSIPSSSPSISSQPSSQPSAFTCAVLGLSDQSMYCYSSTQFASDPGSQKSVWGISLIDELVIVQSGDPGMFLLSTNYTMDDHHYDVELLENDCYTAPSGPNNFPLTFENVFNQPSTITKKNNVELQLLYNQTIVQDSSLWKSSPSGGSVNFCIRVNSYLEQGSDPFGFKVNSLETKYNLMITSISDVDGTSFDIARAEAGIGSSDYINYSEDIVAYTCNDVYQSTVKSYSQGDAVNVCIETFSGSPFEVHSIKDLTVSQLDSSTFPESITSSYQFVTDYEDSELAESNCINSNTTSAVCMIRFQLLAEWFVKEKLTLSGNILRVDGSIKIDFLGRRLDVPIQQNLRRSRSIEDEAVSVRVLTGPQHPKEQANFFTTIHLSEDLESSSSSSKRSFPGFLFSTAMVLIAGLSLL